MKVRTHLLGMLSLFIFSALSTFGQHTLKGIIVDETTDKPLSGVTIALKNLPDNIKTSYDDGSFMFTNLKEGNYSILLTLKGYQQLILTRNLVTPGLNLGVVRMTKRPIKRADKTLVAKVPDHKKESSYSLGKTETIEDVAQYPLAPPKNKPSIIRRDTIRPDMEESKQVLADLMISDLEFETESEVQEISPLLTSSRDVFNNIAGFTFGAAVRYRPRGYMSEYSDIYLNGVQMNDMTSGRVIWSLWGGLNDAVRNQESYIGLKTGGYAFGNIGGVSNIITRASRFRPGSRITYSRSSRTYTNRMMYTYSTGMLPSGWALTFSGSRRWGDRGYVRGTFYDAFGYFLSIEKKFNDHHTLSFTGLGAPTKRGVQNGSTQEVYDLVGYNFYNSNVGLVNDGWRNARVRDNHEPILLLNYIWTINNDTKITASGGYRFGRNGYSALNWYDTEDPRPDYYRNLPSYYAQQGKEKSALAVAERWYSDPNTRYVNWQKLYNVNYHNRETIYNNGKEVANGLRSKYIIEERRQDQRQINGNIVLNTKLSDKLFLDAGIDYRWNNTHFFKTVKDLMGGEYWLDIDQFAERDFPSEPDKLQSDLNHPNRIVREGNTYGYSYHAHVQNYGGWAIATAKLHKADFYLGGNVSNTTFYRYGNYKKGLFPDNSDGKSDVKSFLNYGGKAGFTWKLSGRHFITGNGAYMLKAPTFRNAFISPRTRNTIVSDLKQEQIMSGDLNYQLRTPSFKGRLTGYYTRINDQTDIMSFYDDAYRSFGNYVMTDIDKEFMGMEFGLEAKITPTITAQGMFGYGQFKYTSNPKYVQTVDNTEKILESDRVYWENFNVEGTPMTVGSLGLQYRSPNYWWVGVSGNYFGRSYIDVNPKLRTDKGRAELNPKYIKQEQFGDGFTLDAFAGISIRIDYKYYIGINLSMSNILDRTDIRSGGYEQLRVRVDRETKRMETPFDSRYFYMWGRNFFFNMNFRF